MIQRSEIIKDIHIHIGKNYVNENYRIWGTISYDEGDGDEYKKQELKTEDTPLLEALEKSIKLLERVYEEKKFKADMKKSVGFTTSEDKKQKRKEKKK